MWEVTITPKEGIPEWALKNPEKEMSDFRAETWAKKGWVKLGKHFKYKTEKSICKCCNQVIRKTIKIYSK